MISVCIATYNGERFIQRQLESILSQLSENDEVIISDDGSKDSTLKIIEDMQSPLIRIYKNEGEHGYTPNFENALKHAKGDYIFLSDQDDIWTSDKVEKCLSVLKDYEMVISDACVVDEDEKVIHPSYFEMRKPYLGFWGNLYKCGYIGCCMAFRKELLGKLLPFPVNYRYSPHDYWVVLISNLYYRVKVLDDKLVLYRRHSSNASVGPFSVRQSLGFRISYRCYLLRKVLSRMFMS